jgi:hypothetical protein
MHESTEKRKSNRQSKNPIANRDSLNQIAKITKSLNRKMPKLMLDANEFRLFARLPHERGQDEEHGIAPAPR